MAFRSASKTSSTWRGCRRPAGRSAGPIEIAEIGCRGRGESPRGRRRDHGQDGHDAVRLDRSADHAQPLEPRANAGRLIERLGRGGGLRHVLRRDRHPDRRLDHAAGVVLRRGRDEADTRRSSSTDGVIPFAPSLDHVGPIARTVDDLRLLFDAMLSRRDEADEVRD